VIARLCLAAALATAGGCATIIAGERVAGVAPATLVADPSFNAGLPVTVILRKVDTHEAGPFESRASLSPGPHRVIVDCSVAGTQGKSRFVLDIDAESGARYRLRAELAAGNQRCEDVHIDVQGP
jgi:hypothetical protein